MALAERNANGRFNKADYRKDLAFNLLKLAGLVLWLAIRAFEFRQKTLVRQRLKLK
jgi:hypothetical protein